MQSATARLVACKVISRQQQTEILTATAMTLMGAVRTRLSRKKVTIKPAIGLMHLQEATGRCTRSAVKLCSDNRDHTYFLVLSKVYGCSPAVSRACTEIVRTFTESMDRMCSCPIFVHSR